MPTEELVLDRTHRTRIGQLGRQHVGLVQALQQAETRRARLFKRIQEVRAELATVPIARSLGPLRDAVRQGRRSEGDLEAQLANVR